MTTARRNRELDGVAAGERASVRHRAVRRTAPVGGSNRLLSVEDLAAYLGVPKKTVYGCWRQWGLRGYRVGRYLRFRERHVEEWLLACGFLVDVFCLGVKNTNGPKTVDRRKLPDFARTFFSAWSHRPPVPAPLELARHIVFGAVDYARSLGFEPHPDFAKSAALLGDWETGSSDVTFGCDGKPYYINGPRDDTYGTMAKLRQTLGDGNFDYLIQLPGSY